MIPDYILASHVYFLVKDTTILLLFKSLFLTEVLSIWTSHSSFKFMIHFQCTEKKSGLRLQYGGPVSS